MYDNDVIIGNFCCGSSKTIILKSKYLQNTIYNVNGILVPNSILGDVAALSRLRGVHNLYYKLFTSKSAHLKLILSDFGCSFAYLSEDKILSL